MDETRRSGALLSALYTLQLPMGRNRLDQPQYKIPRKRGVNMGLTLQSHSYCITLLASAVADTDYSVLPLYQEEIRQQISQIFNVLPVHTSPLVLSQCQLGIQSFAEHSPPTCCHIWEKVLT